MTDRITIAKIDITMLERLGELRYLRLREATGNAPRPCLHYSYDGLHVCDE